MYCTNCPKCGAENSLHVVSGCFRADGMLLTQDGFSPMDAKQFDTEDENVRCDSCGAVFNLGDLDLDLKDPIGTDSGSEEKAAVGVDASLEDSSYGHSEVDWALFYELAEAVRRWEGACADGKGKNPA